MDRFFFVRVCCCRSTHQRAWSAAAETRSATWAVGIDRFTCIDDRTPRTPADMRLEGRGESSQHQRRGANDGRTDTSANHHPSSIIHHPLKMMAVACSMQGERAQTQGSRLREERGLCSVKLPKAWTFFPDTWRIRLVRLVRLVRLRIIRRFDFLADGEDQE